MEIKKGIPVSPGICIGQALLLDSEIYQIPERTIKIQEIVAETNRLRKALTQAIRELEHLIKQYSKRLGEKGILIVKAYIKMLQDKHLQKQIFNQIRDDKYTAEYAVSSVFKKHAKALYATDNEFFAHRVQDIYDLERRVLKNLLGQKRDNLSDLKGEFIIIGRDLTPTQTIALDRSKIKGFATDAGGRTSHTAIIARAMGIPAVVGLEGITLLTSAGDLVIIDGNEGLVIVEPDQETIKKYTALEKNFLAFEKTLIDEVKKQPARTKDGYEIRLYANIDAPSEIPLVLNYGASGIGLLRTEFLYTSARQLPSEKSHFETYKKIVLMTKQKEVIIRTLDVGADKLSLEGMPPEKNPFLGCRALRLCFKRSDIFRSQVRAILRAAEFGKISLMLPMVSSLEEIKQAKEMIGEFQRELAQENTPHNHKIKIGIMIEVPAAALITDILIKEVDFISIGTNDLIQYTIAVDRSNKNTASLYQPTHPAVLRLLKYVIEEANKANKTVALCGEMAGEVVFSMLLLGLGLRQFSMAPGSIPLIKKLVRSVTIEESKKLTAKALTFNNAQKTHDFIKKRVQEIIPQVS